MRADGTFIAVEVEEQAAADRALAAKLAEACPVDIFAANDGGELAIVEQNLDECVLCRLCLVGGGGGGPDIVKVLKLYDEEAILE
jgi:ferredoxin-like protein FixX